MKKALSLLVSMFLVAALAPFAFAVETGIGTGIEVSTEEFEPLIWLCDNRVVLDDAVESGRASDVDQNLVERTQNYAFEGEKLGWNVLVMDKNKIEQVEEVVVTIGSVQGVGNDIEVECKEAPFPQKKVPAECEARILEESLTGTDFDDDTQAWYECLLTVETPLSMYGEYWVTVEVISADGEATIDENEFWFLNPVVGLAIDGDLLFEDVRPGTVSYSSTLAISNDADDGSGVLLDMFISGTDFYDPDSSGAACPDTNALQLSHSDRSQAKLGHLTATNAAHAGATPRLCEAGTAGLTGATDADHLCYFATNGAYSTFNAENGNAAQNNADAEGFRPIVYSDVFTADFYNDAEIIANDDLNINGVLYDAGNVLAPGADIAVTFKLGLPEPCVGDFSDGSLYFWGEAI